MRMLDIFFQLSKHFFTSLFFVIVRLVLHSGHHKANPYDVPVNMLDNIENSSNILTVIELICISAPAYFTLQFPSNQLHVMGHTNSSTMEIIERSSPKYDFICIQSPRAWPPLKINTSM